MAVSVVQRKTAVDSAGTSGTVSAAMTSNVTAGNCLVVIASMSDTTAALFNKELQPPTDTLGNKFYQIGNAFNSTFGVGMEIWVAYNILGGADTISMTNNGNEAEVAVYEVSGLPYYAAMNQSLVASIAAATSYDTGNMSATTVANALILAGFVSSPSDNWTAGTGYSNIQNVGGTQNTQGTEEKIVSSTGTYNATATHTNNQAGAAGIIALGDTPTIARRTTVKSLGSTMNTTSGTHTLTATPAVGDLIVIIRANTGNTTSHAPTDNNADGNGTYSLATSALKNTSADLMEVWVRNSRIGSATSTVFTDAAGTTTGGGIHVYKVTGMTKAGSSAVKQVASQANQAANATPAPTFSGSVTSPNPVITAVFNTTNSTISNPVVPLNFAHGLKTAYGTPATSLQSGYSEGGLFTGTAVTWTAQSASVWCSVAVELDSSTSNAASSSMTDTFPGTSLNGQWDSFTNTGSTLAVNNDIEFGQTGANATYCGLTSHSPYNFENSSIYVEITDAGVATWASKEITIEVYDADNPSVNGFYVIIGDGSGTADAISLYKKVNSTQTQLWTTTFNATSHKWVRLREASGIFYFDTSPDGTTWTNQWSGIREFNVTNMVAELSVGHWSASETGTTTVKMDNFNTTGAAPTGQNFFF